VSSIFNPNQIIKPMRQTCHKSFSRSHFRPESLYRSGAQDYIQRIRGGVPASFVEYLSAEMALSKECLYRTLRLASSTIERKIMNSEDLSPDHTERVLGFARLIGQVQVMVSQIERPKGFDARLWFSAWTAQPLDAMNGARPDEFMDTVAGQEFISRLITVPQLRRWVHQGVC